MIITTAPHCYSSKRLQQEFRAKFNTTVTMLNPKKLNSGQWQNYHSSFPTLIRSTGINYDDSDLFFAQTFQTPMIQPIDELLIFRDKLRQFLWAQQHHITTVPTEYNYDCTSTFPTGPFIVKSRRGMQGKGIIYIENKKSLLSLLKTLHSINDQQFLVQQYIAATEYRYFVLAGKIQHVLKKERTTEEVIANAASGVSTTLVDNYPTTMVQSIIPLLSAHYYAIDLLYHEEEELLLEINLAPGFEQLEKLSGDNIARKIWDDH